MPIIYSSALFFEGPSELVGKNIVATMFDVYGIFKHFV